MNIYKIKPFSGKDTSGDYTLIAITIRYIGNVTVEPTSQGMFQVDYFTDASRIREANRDVITKETIQAQLVNMGFEAAQAEPQAEEMMKMAILHLVGGTSKEERYATLSAIIGGFGMELLPLEEQDGVLEPVVNNFVPAVTPMQEIPQ